MIQESIKNYLEDNIIGLEWTVDFKTTPDNTGTVYAESPSGPDKYDTEYRYPSYQVMICSSDWDFAKAACMQVYDLLHKTGNYEVTENDRNYYVFLIMSSSDILRLGVDDNDVMTYTVNFDITLKEEL